jgi:hypothetical protein
MKHKTESAGKCMDCKWPGDSEVYRLCPCHFTEAEFTDEKRIAYDAGAERGEGVAAQGPDMRVRHLKRRKPKPRLFVRVTGFKENPDHQPGDGVPFFVEFEMSRQRPEPVLRLGEEVELP